MSPIEFARHHKRITIILSVLGLLVALAGLGLAAKKVSPLAWGWYGPVHTDDGLALAGVDPVSYQRGGPVPGTLSYRWRDAEWRFATEENRAAFEAEPERYAPQFGGFCSFAVSKGFTALSSPRAWVVREGRLYLFADDGIRADWSAQVEHGIIEAAEQNWARR